MKNKKFTYLLIACVTIVWGVIFYRIFASVPEKVSLNNSLAIIKGDTDTSNYTIQDTFTLALNYRDPFLDENHNSKPEVPTTNILPTPPPDIKPKMNWDLIKYGGYVINPKTGKRISIISINGIERMVDEGELISGVKVVKNYRDSVKVLYQDNVKFILLK